MSKPVKITVVGDGAVGKTCLLIGYTKKKYNDKYIPTVFENYADNITVDGIKHNVTLWDTAGQEDYERLRPLSYPNTTCFLLCYSISHKDSYLNVKTKWAPEIRHHMPHAPIILVGTKSDLRQEDVPNLILLTEKDGKKMKAAIKAEGFYECSAKLLKGLDEVIAGAVRCSIKSRASRKSRASNCILL